MRPLAILASMVLAVQPAPASARPILQSDTSATFESNGFSIYYESHGRGPAVVFLHGFGGRFDLARFPGLRRATLGYRLIGVDVRGFGRSAHPSRPEDYGIQVAEDVIRLLDHLGVPDAHLIGYSMGGIIGLKVASMYPNRVRSVMLVGQGWVPRWQLESMAASGLDVARADPAVLSAAQLRDVQRYGLHAFAGFIPGYPELYVTPAEIQAMTLPLLAILGSEDPRVARAEALRTQKPSARVLVVPGRNHSDIVMDASLPVVVMGFLSSVEQMELASDF